MPIGSTPVGVFGIDGQQRIYCLFPLSDICGEEHVLKRVLTTLAELALSDVCRQTMNFYCVTQPLVFCTIC
jgi:hypothetical protein